MYNIINDDGLFKDVPTPYLNAHEQAHVQMRKAEKALLDILPHVTCEYQRQHLKRVHKKMVKLRKEWGHLEEFRSSEVFVTSTIPMYGASLSVGSQGSSDKPSFIYGGCALDKNGPSKHRWAT